MRSICMNTCMGTINGTSVDRFIVAMQIYCYLHALKPGVNTWTSMQRFNLLTIKGWNSAQRRQYLSKEECYRAYATDVSTYYGACKRAILYVSYFAVPGIELSVLQSSVSQTRCYCHCVSHNSDSLTQSERCSHTYQVPVTAILLCHV